LQNTDALYVIHTVHVHITTAKINTFRNMGKMVIEMPMFETYEVQTGAQSP